MTAQPIDGISPAGRSQHARGWYLQPTFDDLGQPLADVTFCVVDLETTGGSPRHGHRVTEVAAVCVSGGEISHTYATLVNPERRIPSMITARVSSSLPVRRMRRVGIRAVSRWGCRQPRQPESNAA